MDIGKRIAHLREKRNLTQKELANRAKLNPSVMNRIETGERPLRADELTIIANILGVTSDYILGRSDDPRLTEDQQKEVDEEFQELKKIIESLPQSEQEKVKQMVVAYVKGYADSLDRKENKQSE